MKWNQSEQSRVAGIVTNSSDRSSNYVNFFNTCYKSQNL